MTQTSFLKFSLITPQQDASAQYNAAMLILDAAVPLRILDKDLTSAPGSPAEGDTYIVGSGATGPWSTHDDDVVIYVNGDWWYATPESGVRGWLVDENAEVVFENSSWQTLGHVSVATGLTASTTQSQGQVPLTKGYNRFSTVANANDAATLPSAALGRVCAVRNDGANTLQLFPASGDKIDGGATDASTTIAAGKSKIFTAVDATDWYSFPGA